MQAQGFPWFLCLCPSFSMPVSVCLFAAVMLSGLLWASLWCCLVSPGVVEGLGRALLALAGLGFYGIFAVTQFSRNGLFLGPVPSLFLRPVTAAVSVRTKHTFSAFWL